MRRIIFLWLIVLFVAPAAAARPLDPEATQKLLLPDRLDVGSNRHLEEHHYSRFPKGEKKLHLAPVPRRDPLQVLYSGEHTLTYTVQPNDSLKKIARRFGTTIEFMMELNQLTAGHLRVGRKLFIWDQPFTIEVNKTFNRLSLKAGEAVIKEYPVSTGKASAQTPSGIYHIQSRYPYPVWFHKGTVVPGGSAENYLGSRWLGFDKPQYGIHGTIFPGLIGQSVSKGCIRMKNEDVEELYELIPVGTTVLITE